MPSQSLRLRPVPGDVRLARQYCALAARSVFGPDSDGLVDDAEMVASELVTNAIRAGASVIVLEVDVSDVIRIAVIDDAAGEVRPRMPRTFDTSGRGLHIVGAIADQWGVETLPSGKRVWAQIPAPTSLMDDLTDVAS